MNCVVPIERFIVICVGFDSLKLAKVRLVVEINHCDNAAPTRRYRGIWVRMHAKGLESPTANTTADGWLCELALAQGERQTAVDVALSLRELPENS